MVEKGTFSKEDAAPPSEESHEVSTGHLKLERTEGKKCFELNFGLLYLLFCFKLYRLTSSYVYWPDAVLQVFQKDAGIVY